MGYCVSMRLSNVEIDLKETTKAKDILVELNESWHKNNDWCRFSVCEDDYEDDLDYVLNAIEDIGFSCGYNDTHIYIEDFEREKLGDHENMFIKLAPILDDCDIKFYGEDDTDWKITIKDGKAEKIYREEF